jgi:hypothetical protein
MNRTGILTLADDTVNGERQDQYGNPEDNFAVIGRLWEIFITAKCLSVDASGKPYCKINPPDVANLMILLKVARNTTGNVDKVDTWVDIAGYAACGGAMLQPETNDNNR